MALDSAKEFFTYFDEPEKAFKKQKENYLIDMAKKLEEVKGTPGWKEIIEPFLKREGDPARFFKADVRSDPQAIGRIEAFYRFQRVLGIFQNYLDAYRKQLREK